MATISRRGVLGSAAALAALGLVPHVVRAQSNRNAAAKPPAPKGTKLVMLGTRGGPGVDLGRGETASAVVADGVAYLLDCGYGTLRALVASGLGFQNVDTLFFSHLHNDHTADLAALLMHQWTSSKKTPTNIYGPYATAST